MWFGASKGREAVHMEIEKPMFYESLFAGALSTAGDREDLDQRDLTGFFPVCPPGSGSTRAIYKDRSLWEHVFCPKSFRL